MLRQEAILSSSLCDSKIATCLHVAYEENYVPKNGVLSLANFMKVVYEQGILPLHLNSIKCLPQLCTQRRERCLRQPFPWVRENWYSDSTNSCKTQGSSGLKSYLCFFELVLVWTMNILYHLVITKSRLFEYFLKMTRRTGWLIIALWSSDRKAHQRYRGQF